MASEKAYLCYVLDQVSSLDEVSYRAMMGEYVLYCRGKVIGGIYDDRLMVKKTPSAQALLPDAPEAAPYPGAKNMLLPDVDDRELLTRLFSAVADDLAAPDKRR
ncbi:MAG: TfoX/Sxy family protein [Oscillospiraceae bacterium]|nr:TfoX/Sxy family protein [Oscillospiraceae bacterium]